MRPRFRRRRTIICQEWVELVTDYIEGVLPRDLQDAADRHLADCASCREYLAQMRRTVGVARHLRDDDLPDDVVDALARALSDYRRKGG